MLIVGAALFRGDQLYVTPLNGFVNEDISPDIMWARKTDSGLVIRS